jgi:hypothetical protein
MKHSLRYCFFIGLVFVTLTTSCSSIKTVHVWKDDTYNQRLRKVLVIAVAELDFMRNHFENVLSQSLVSSGVEAIPGNKVLPQPEGKLDRKAILAKVRELGIDSVLVVRSVNKKEVSKFQPGGVYLMPTNFNEDWYGFYSDSFIIVSDPGRAYDADYFTLVTNVYNVSSDKLIWSNLSQVKVENSREGAINPFIDWLMKQLEDSKLL